MKSAYFYCLLTATLTCISSCRTSDEKLSGAKIYIAEGLQVVVYNEWAYGEEHRYALKEITEDRTEPQNYKRMIIQLYQSLLEMEEEGSKVIKFIEKTKKEMFLSFKENTNPSDKNSIVRHPYSEKDPLLIASYKLDKVEYNGTTSILKQEGKFGKALISTFHTYRKAICELIASSVIVEKGQKSYFFTDPIIEDYTSIDDLENQVDQAIKSSRVSQDDQEAIKKIYMLLSHNSNEWEQLLADDIHWADAMSILLQMENDVLNSRTYAIRLLRSRSGCCENYGFNVILPMVFGPEVARQGDDIYMDVIMVAFDSTKEPEVEAHGAEVVSVKDGKARLKVNVGNASEVTIKGTITIKNKSGVPKTMPWSKTIVVLPYDKDYEAVHGPRKK